MAINLKTFLEKRQYNPIVYRDQNNIQIIFTVDNSLVKLNISEKPRAYHEIKRECLYRG